MTFFRVRAVVHGKNDFFVFCPKNGFALRPSKKSIVHGIEKMKIDFFHP
jgi:hypothetical protein